MRTPYTTILLVFAAVNASAQITPADKPLLPGEARFHVQAPPADGNRGSSLYLETFDTGLGDWSSVTTDGDVDWKWTDVGPGPTPSTYPVPPLNTTPGWAIIDDDFEGTSGEATEAYLISPVIDLSGGPTQLKLEFDQYFQEFQNDSTFVGISTDGGSTWNEIEINQGVGRDNRPNPETRIVNISDWVSVAPSTVQIRFRYVSVWDYGWQIDNIGVYELPPYELVLNYGFISHTGGGEEYGRIPSAQINNELNVGAELFNGGSMPLNGLEVTMEVLDDGDNLVYSETFEYAELGPWDTVLVEEMITIPAPAEGIYRATFTATSNEQDMDDDLENNTHLRNYMVNESLYSLDGIGLHPDGMEALSSVGTESFEGGEDALFIMNYYPITDPATIYGIQFDLHSSTVPGGYVFVSILDSLDVWSDVVNQPLAESQILDITQNHIDAATVNVAFDEPLQLGSGAYYAAVVLHSVAGTAHMRIMDDQTVAQPALSAAIHISNDISYTNGNAWAIRMIMDPMAISVPENDQLSGISMFPNPTEGLLTINSTEGGSYDVEVIDMLGARVMSDRISGSTVIDLGGNASGVYMVRISNEKGSFVERITLK